MSGPAAGLSPVEAVMLTLGAVAVVLVLAAPLALLAPWRLAVDGRLPVAAGQAVAVAVRAWWRLVPLTPPGMVHERHVRRQLGMGRKHPEHVTRHPSRADRRLLEALQAQAWPEGEWTDVIKAHLEDL